MFAFIEQARLVISNDTGPVHIGAAMKTPTIGLFGPNLPERFGPFGRRNVAIYKPGSCKLSPCINVHEGETPDCLFAKGGKDYQRCMKAITAADVMQAVRNILH